MPNSAWPPSPSACAARALRPAQRQRQRALGVLARGGRGEALVERHRDVGAERALDLDHRLRREEARGAVERRAKLDAVVADLADLGQAEDLEAARVGQDGPAPAHEAVQPAELAHDVGPGTQQQMVGVAQHDAGAGGVEILGRERLDRGLRTDRHEDRRVHHAVGGGEATAARGAVGREQVECHGVDYRRSMARGLIRSAWRRRTSRSGSGLRRRGGTRAAGARGRRRRRPGAAATSAAGESSSAARRSRGTGGPDGW